MALQNYLEDDWNDNALTSRSNPEKGLFYQYSTGGTGDLLKGVYRPQWKQDAGSSEVTNNELRLNHTGENIQTPSNLTVGNWKIDFRGDSSGNNYISFSIISTTNSTVADSTRTASGYNFYVEPSNSEFNFQRQGSNSITLISTSSNVNNSNYTTCEVSRDSYGNMEIFEDGNSIGTATDTTYTTSRYIIIGHDDNGGGNDAYADNLIVN